MRWCRSHVAIALGLALGLGLAACGSDEPTQAPGGGEGPGPVGTTPSSPPAPSDPAVGVTVRLHRVAGDAEVLSFGVPVPPGALADAATVRVTAAGAAVAASLRETLATYDGTGARTGVRAFLVQVPASAMTADTLDLQIVWKGEGGEPPGATFETFDSERVSAAAPHIVDTTKRSIQKSGATYALTEAAHVSRTLFTGREARAVALFPDGYLAATGILGEQVTAEQAKAPGFAGLRFLSDAMSSFSRSAMYGETFALNPDSIIDPVVEYEGWLYDRCATFLTAYAHAGEERVLRHAMQTCSYYARHITLTGPNTGIFDGKTEPDPKYSHLRGLYVYYALTGDEAALAAGRAIADLWLNDPNFVAPYRKGHLRGPDKLWTERLLGTSLEGLLYGHRLTGDAANLTALREMFETAYRHITGTAATLATVNPGATVFPPQSCWVHTAEQHAEGVATDPWCSPWMSELTIDALLRYQEQTADARVDEVFIRLAHFMRDNGTVYFRGDSMQDTFLKPGLCYSAKDVDQPRILVPVYGAGTRKDGSRYTTNDNDNEHCADATALTAVALRALRRSGTYDKNPIPPFASDGESILQLHHELAACARWTFSIQSRPRRDPAVWTSAELAPGAADPAAFIVANKIGWPLYNVGPQRKLSWWFNVSMLQFGLLASAGIDLPELRPGKIQPAGMTCK